MIGKPLLPVRFKAARSDFPLDKYSSCFTHRRVRQKQEVTLDVNLAVKTGTCYLSDFPSCLLIATFTETMKKCSYLSRDFCIIHSNADRTNRVNLALEFAPDRVSSRHAIFGSLLRNIFLRQRRVSHGRQPPPKKRDIPGVSQPYRCPGLSGLRTGLGNDQQSEVSAGHVAFKRGLLTNT